MTKFNLSDKRRWGELSSFCIKRQYYYPQNDVKEFIREERKLLQLVIDLQITWIEFLKKRDKLAGDKLNGA